MVAFRKVFPVLAIVALLLGSSVAANAQAVGTSPLVCTANAGVPPLVRAEGLTELVGDIVLVCTGGPANPQPFLANFTLFLNTNITSRLLGSDLTEALLLIDEPGVQRTEGVGGTASPATPLCLSPGVTSNSLIDPLFTCNPQAAGAPSLYQRGTYTAFRARTFQQNAVTWPGVPVLPPGTNGTRVFRFTNVRANASIIGAAASGILIPNQITAFISVSGSQSVAIDNPQQTVAYVQRGLAFDVRNCNNSDPAGNPSLAQCVSQTADFDIFGVRFTEGFQTAFKRVGQAGQENSLPGTVYNTESGFVNINGFGGASNIGLANSGTRLYARFTNLPAEASIFVTIQKVGGSGSANARLVSTGPNGEGGGTITGTTQFPFPVVGSGAQTIFSAVPGSTNIALCAGGATPGQIDGNNAAQIQNVGGTALAVWEITEADPSALENLFFAVAVSYTANTASQTPAVGQTRVSGGFAPFYPGANVQDNASGRASSSLPIPRFLQTVDELNAFRIDACETNLLFPFVTAQAGFDTGIAISNTSADPFANPQNRRQAGRCTINYFGNVTGGGNAPNPQTTNADVPAGGQLTFVLSSGGNLGIAGTPGFQGYIFARCLFRYAHGFAFITDGPIGSARVAEGYLALVVDGGTVNQPRGQVFGENLGH